MSQKAAIDYAGPLARGGVSNRVKLLVGFAILLTAMGYFAYLAFQSATVYYYTVSELKEIGPIETGELVRVSGKLVPDSFYREEGSVLAHFILTDDTETVNAVHSGAVPDQFFNEHSDIVLEGTYHPGGVFESQNVIVKCPSKYIAAE